MINGKSQIFVEPDGEYTTVTVWSDTEVGGETLITPGQNQTIAAAFNKGRDDLASLITGGKKVKSVTIMARIE